MSITPFLTDGGVFDPSDIKAMSVAFDETCAVLGISEANARGREVIATRIIALALDGERSPTLLRDGVLQEMGLADAVVAEGHGTKRPLRWSGL